jgi:transcriptional regulator GlxA family with amidase domain
MKHRTLSRAFQRHLSEPPAQFMKCVHMKHARGLLEEAVSLKMMATQSGFGDVQRMRRRYGMSMAQYAAAFARPRR